MVVYYRVRFSLWCLTPFSKIVQLYRGGQFIEGGNHRLFIAERLLISISVERWGHFAQIFFFTRGPTLKCMTTPWLTIQIGSKILSDEYSIIILTGRKITYENGRKKNKKKCNLTLFASFKPGIPQERYLEPGEDMVLFVLILHTNAFSNKFVCNVRRSKNETFLTKMSARSSYTCIFLYN